MEKGWVDVLGGGREGENYIIIMMLLYIYVCLKRGIHLFKIPSFQQCGEYMIDS